MRPSRANRWITTPVAANRRSCKACARLHRAVRGLTSRSALSPEGSHILSKTAITWLFSWPVFPVLSSTMSSIYHYFSEKQVLWDDFPCSSQELLRVSECWQAGVDDPALTRHIDVRNHDLQEWLHTTDGITLWTNGRISRRCVLRIVWIERDRTQRVNLIDQDYSEPSVRRVRAAIPFTDISNPSLPGLGTSVQRQPTASRISCAPIQA